MRRIVSAMAIAFVVLASAPAKAGDIIDLDLALVDPEAQQLILDAETFWEERIAGYSSELPVILRRQLTQLQLSALVGPVDGVGGILGFAGPDVTARLDAQSALLPDFEVALTASMVFDIDDFPSQEEDGTLFSTIVHEMCHALGFGGLWVPVGLLDATGQYTGVYGVQQFQLESGLTTAPTVPVETEGGPGSAFAHWDDSGFFSTLGQPNPRKEVMTAFACDLNPELPFTSDGMPNLICLPTFVSQATLGGLADLGFAVIGINDEFAVPISEIAVPTFDKGSIGPTNLGGGAFLVSNRAKVSRIAFPGSTGADTVEAQIETSSDDPYNLRAKRWTGNAEADQ